MKEAMRLKWQKFVAYVISQLAESSTIRGIASVLTLGTGMVIDDGKLAGWVALSVSISAILKVFLPDRWTKE